MSDEQRIAERVFNVERLIEHVGCGSVDDVGACPFCQRIRDSLLRLNELSTLRARLEAAERERDEAKRNLVNAFDFASANEFLLEANAELKAENTALRQRAEAAERERDAERSRFAFYADTFGDLAYDLDRRAGSDWGHLRHRVLGTVRAAVTAFRKYANGQPSPSNWRVRAEKAEAENTALRQRLRELEEQASAVREDSTP